jgi:hypothetical protein
LNCVSETARALINCDGRVFEILDFGVRNKILNFCARKNRMHFKFCTVILSFIGGSSMGETEVNAFYTEVLDHSKGTETVQKQ